MDRGSQLDEEDDEEDDEEEERRRGEEEQATDIKSNNPHLAGGEHIVFKNIYHECNGDVFPINISPSSGKGWPSVFPMPVALRLDLGCSHQLPEL